MRTSAAFGIGTGYREIVARLHAERRAYLEKLAGLETEIVAAV